MSRSDWLRVLALGAPVVALLCWSVWWGAVSYPLEQAEQRQHTAPRAADPSQQQAREACAGEPRLVDYSNCILEQQRAAREEQRAQYDLQAQQEMALWAFAIFVSGVVGLGITGAGVYFVVLTLKANREAVDVAREASRLDNRAWVKINMPEIADFWLNDYGRYVTEFDFSFENVGRGVALDLSAEAAIFAISFELDDQEIALSDAAKLADGLFILGHLDCLYPGDKDLKGCMAAMDDDPPSDPHEIFVVIRVTYRLAIDPKGRERRTTQVFRRLIAPDRTGVFRPGDLSCEDGVRKFPTCKTTAPSTHVT